MATEDHVYMGPDHMGTIMPPILQASSTSL